VRNHVSKTRYITIYGHFVILGSMPDSESPCDNWGRNKVCCIIQTKIVACWTVFTELLSGNASMKSVTISSVATIKLNVIISPNIQLHAVTIKKLDYRSLRCHTFLIKYSHINNFIFKNIYFKNFV
jgi:hypothetical protein